MIAISFKNRNCYEVKIKLCYVICIHTYNRTQESREFPSAHLQEKQRTLQLQFSYYTIKNFWYNDRTFGACLRTEYLAKVVAEQPNIQQRVAKFASPYYVSHRSFSHSQLTAWKCKEVSFLICVKNREKHLKKNYLVKVIVCNSSYYIVPSQIPTKYTLPNIRQTLFVQKSTCLPIYFVV